MKLFISWSGQTSMKLGEVLRDWIPSVLQSVKPYFTPEDIAKGAKWQAEISKHLEQTNFGLICITKENTSSPWVLFEAGALSKQIDNSHVCPILLDLEPGQVQGPLSLFQATRASQRDDVFRLIQAINNKCELQKLDDKVLQSVFNKWWPDLETSIKRIIAESPKHADNQKATPVATERISDEALLEILSNTREIVRRFIPPRTGDSSAIFGAVRAFIGELGSAFVKTGISHEITHFLFDEVYGAVTTMINRLDFPNEAKEILTNEFKELRTVVTHTTRTRFADRKKYPTEVGLGGRPDSG